MRGSTMGNVELEVELRKNEVEMGLGMDKIR